MVKKQFHEINSVQLYCGHHNIIQATSLKKQEPWLLQSTITLKECFKVDQIQKIC